MSWIALVGPEIEENLSLRYLASSLAAAGFSAEIIPCNGEHHVVPAVQAILTAPEPPLMVGLSLAFQWRALDMLALALALREGGYVGHVTIGGHFATFAATELLSDFPEIDTVVRQEAEETMVALASAVESGGPLDGIAGLALRDERGVQLTAMPAVPDLAKLPWPDRRGEPAACFGHGIAPFVSSRGCYANCTFCCIAAWHEQTLPGRRYRVREPEAVADELAHDHHTRGTEIFVFHDDNFFVPGKKRNLERFHALADALEARGLRRFATVVKARPTDVDAEVFQVLRERLHCIRCYVGVETDSDQGLETLRRWARPRQNHEAIEIVRALGLYVCFNMLIFDPDTTLESLHVNLDFMEFAADYPSNFGRVELYAGTPLLHRMKQEDRVRGDYLQWDYDLHDAGVERVFRLAMTAFHARNFGPGALNNRIMGTRFDVEVARHFHPDRFRPEWMARGIELTRALGCDSVAALREIMQRVESGTPDRDDAEFAADLATRLRRRESQIDAGARALAEALYTAIGQGLPLTVLGDRVATPLQRGTQPEAAQSP